MTDRCPWVVALLLAVLVGSACDQSRGVPAQSVVGDDAGSPVGLTDAGTAGGMDAAVDPSFRGYYATGLSELDAAYALLPLDVMQSLIALPPDRVHEIAAHVADPWGAPDAAQRLTARLEEAGLALDVDPWTTFRPEMVEYAELAGASYWILLVVVFGMAIFGVANTMLMAAFERRREFALLLALGATPSGIVRAVVWEALALGAISLLVGAAITVPVLVWWHNAPLDVSGLFGDFTFAGALIRPVLRVEYPESTLILGALALVLTALLAAMYPAIRAARVPPADTMSGR